jgi:hypothetical protein
VKRSAFSFPLALVCAASFCVARPVHATPPPADAPALESEALVARALDLRVAGRDREALPLLVRAAAFDPSPRNRAQLALGQQAMGDWIEAERGLSAVLAPPLDPWIARHSAPLEEALETVRRQLGSLEIEGDVPGAEVTLNGAFVGTLPLAGAVRVPTGVASVKVSAPGHGTVSRLVQISAGEHAREVLTLPVEPAPAPPALPRERATDKAESLAAPVATPPRARTRGRALESSLIAGSGVALAAGIAATAERETEAAKYNMGAQTYNSACAVHCPEARPSPAAVNVLTGLSIAGYAVSATLGAAATVLLLRHPSSAHASSARGRAAWSCMVGLPPSAPGAGGSFGVGVETGCRGEF